ncbi:MAG: hypothetical protein J7J06_06710 [Methanosarcinales archaeon]|nr:hypothetical protein [Methanosarcinales archaeon]
MAVLLIGTGNSGSALLNSVSERGAKKNPKIAINPKVAPKQLRKKDQYTLTDKGFFRSGSDIAGRQEFKDAAESASVMDSYDAVLLELLNDKIEGVDAAIIFLGLGGATGSGIATIVARALNDLGIPILITGVLPAPGGADMSAQYRNASYTIDKLKKYTDAFILIDNKRIAYADNIESTYPQYNQYAAAVVSDILSGSDQKTSTASSISVRDVIASLSLRGGGFSVFGRASILSKDLLHYFVPVGGHNAIDVATLVGVAVEKLSMDVDTRAARKSTALLRVPSWYMKKENAIDTGSIERFQQENSSDGSRLGISLTKRSLVTLTLIFTFACSDLPRLREIEDEMP